MNIHHVLGDPYPVSFDFDTIPVCLFLKIQLPSSYFYIHSVYVKEIMLYGVCKC